MKKIVAVSLVLASGAAFAQSSVTLYGIADMNIASRKSADTGERTTQVNSSGIYESRIGFKGSEDLGGGLKANFQLEQGIAMNTGATNGFSRQSWVGLSGGFGAVKLGRALTAFQAPVNATDPWGTLQQASTAVLTSGYFTDKENNLGFSYMTGVMPTTVLYDAQGKEVWRMIGGMDWNGSRASALMEETLAKGGLPKNTWVCENLAEAAQKIITEYA
mgnify:CR=1 FL=1